LQQPQSLQPTQLPEIIALEKVFAVGVTQLLARPVVKVYSTMVIGHNALTKLDS